MGKPRSSRPWQVLPLATLASLTLAATHASARSSDGSFPVTVRAANGLVTIARRPSRVVSLSATATEDLYAVGAGKQVVAVDAYSSYPRQAPRTRLSGSTPNLEAIAKYRPDLVLIDSDANGIVGQLAKLQVPVLVEPPATNLDAAYAQIAQIAAATGHAKAAAAVNARIERQVKRIVRSVPRPRTTLSVYHELGPDYYSATSFTFIGQMYKLLGLRNIADRAKGASNYPQLSAEYIIASNPDLIVLADTVCCAQTKATVAHRGGWSQITAVKKGAIVPVNDAIASEWGPRIVLFLRVVARAVRSLEASK